MLRLVALSLFSVVSFAAADNKVVAFSGSGYDGWTQWDWKAMTHLAFWSTPSEDVRAQAAANGVKLFQVDKAHLDPADWGSDSKVSDAVGKMQQQIKDNKLDGLFFDYEGNGLSTDQKKEYTKYIKEVSKAVAPAEVFVCVGGRPDYEWRDYDYKGLADVSSFLFIMGYDMHFYDDYTCVTKGTCSPAEAPLADLKAGVKDYLKDVSADKLVLGLPWYGQVYTQVLGVLYNQGQADVKDIWPILYGDKTDRKQSHTLYDNDKDYAWKLICNNACLDSKKGGVIWYDDDETLQKKYKLVSDNGLLGIGIWEVDKLDYTGKYDKYVSKMWGAVTSWSQEASREATVV